MARLRMNDNQWRRIRPMIPDGKPGGRPPLDRRVIIDGIVIRGAAILRNYTFFVTAKDIRSAII